MPSSFRAEFAGLIAQLLGLDVESYTSLTATEDNLCFVTKDGGLMTLLRVYGHRHMIGESEIDRLADQLTTLFGANLTGLYHTLDICFTSDPDDTAAEIASLLEPGRRTAERQQLDVADLFAERIRHLPRYTAAESCYLAVWTSPQGLPRSTRRQAVKQKRRAIRDRKLPGGLRRHNQNPYVVNDYLPDTHRSLVKTLVNELTAFQFDIETIDVAAACRTLRALIDPDWAAAAPAANPDGRPRPAWTPAIAGQPPPIRVAADGRTSNSDAWLPALGSQLVPRSPRLLDYRTVQVGDRLYQPLYVDAPQLTEVQRFEQLFDRIRRERLPWRLHIRLEGNAAQWLSAKRSIATLLYFAGHQNKLIVNSCNALRRFMNEGGVAVRCQMAMTSWVTMNRPLPDGQQPLELLRARTAQLASYVQSWGTCTLRERTGHPIKAYTSSLPGFTRYHIGTRYAAPLNDLARTLPLYRPASPWRTGAVLFRTRDGRLYPYQPGSSLQVNWNTLYFAKPGSGKSVAMHANNLALILSAGFNALPFVRIIDIGPSSEGLISLVREGLPVNRRQESQFHALENDARFAINPLDTQLGYRRQLPQERAFGVSFLSILATRPGDTAPPEGVADLIGKVLDLAFEHFDDYQAPKRYDPHQDSAVDAALARHSIETDPDTSWWQLVDRLFDDGDLVNAMRAQRYAVPLLSDLPAVAQQPQVQDIYGAMRLFNTDESPIQLLNRVLSAATRELPILAYPTRFDIGNARVCSLDIAALCGDETVVGQRQTALAYMLARHALGRDLFLTPLSASLAPARYQPHHRRRFETNLQYPKKLCADELHRCGRLPSITGQFTLDMREGRKNNVLVDLSSQILRDFTDEMIELSSSRFILQYGNDDQAEEVREMFSLPRTAMTELRRYGNGPGPDGAPMLCAFETKRGQVYQLLYLTLGAIEMWALSTTAEDRALRARLYEHVGPRMARAALAQRYPTGSIKDEVERRLDASADSALDREAIVQQIIDELLANVALQRRDAIASTTTDVRLASAVV